MEPRARTQVQGPRADPTPSFAKFPWQPGHLHCISRPIPPPSLNNKHSLSEAREGQTRRLERGLLSLQSISRSRDQVPGLNPLPITPFHFIPSQAKPTWFVHTYRLLSVHPFIHKSLIAASPGFDFSLRLLQAGQPSQDRTTPTQWPLTV